MSRNLEGRVALVTGAASGIGRATATLFARAGAALSLVDLDCEGGEAATREIETRLVASWRIARSSSRL